jgi:hypothetical protein
MIKRIDRDEYAVSKPTGREGKIESLLRQALQKTTRERKPERRKQPE